MRIIGGKFKARRIEPPKNLKARPTTDFAKEGLFNLLDNRIDIEGIKVLELFSGSGSIGLEFVSRSASMVTGIELNYNHVSFINKTCIDLGIDNYNIIKGDVFKYIGACSLQYDMIFADPPYDLKNLNDIPDLVFANSLLSQDGLFVLEHGRTNDFSEHPNFVDHRNYGNVHFSFFRTIN